MKRDPQSRQLHLDILHTHLVRQAPCRTASRATTPAAWPVSAAAGITRVTSQASPSAEMQRPAASSPRTPCGISVPSGISQAGPGLRQSPDQPDRIRQSARQIGPSTSVARPIMRRVVRNCACDGSVSGEKIAGGPDPRPGARGNAPRSRRRPSRTKRVTAV